MSKINEAAKKDPPIPPQATPNDPQETLSEGLDEVPIALSPVTAEEAEAADEVVIEDDEGPSAVPPAPDGGSATAMASALCLAIAALEKDVRAGRDKFLRAAADLENYKRRARRELADAVARAENKVVLEFLPVIDNLERAIQHTSLAEADDPSSLAEGVKMVQRQFLATLARYDIVPFDAIGQVFDPERHEAIQQAPSEQPRHVVIAEVLRGYLRGERLVRAAQVVVSMGPPLVEVASGTDAASNDEQGATCEDKVAAAPAERDEP